MNKIKLIALDMDGTLLNDDGIITDYTKQIIQEVQQKGINVVISTGRPLASCISYVRELELTSYVITSNGAQTFTVEEQLVEEHTMEADAVEQLWKVGHDRQLHMWLVAADAIFVQGRRPHDFGEHDWLKMGYGNLDMNDKIYVLEQIKSIPDLEITNSTTRNIEVNGKGVSKEQSLRSLCEWLGLTMEEVMAFGDGLNDYRMIKEAGVGVAVANAQEEILDIADYITLTNEEDGVALAIEKYILKT